MTEDEFEPLPSMMGLVAAGDTRPEVVKAARAEARGLRRQALDDQMLAACLDAFGGDETTARFYWRAGRLVSALSTGTAKITDPAELVEWLREHGSIGTPPNLETE